MCRCISSSMFLSFFFLDISVTCYFTTSRVSARRFLFPTQFLFRVGPSLFVFFFFFLPVEEQKSLGRISRTHIGRSVMVSRDDDASSLFLQYNLSHTLRIIVARDRYFNDSSTQIVPSIYIYIYV